MLKTAIILAAGCGNRFKDMTLYRPKGFIEFMGKPMIIRSLDSLIQTGFEEIIIGVGYQSQWFEMLKTQYPQIKFVKVNNYDSTGSLYTLFCLRNLIKNDFLLLESDIVFEKEIIKDMSSFNDENVILATSLIKFQDQFYIEANERSKLVNCSFDASELNRVDGEWTGINKISIETYKEICEIIKSDPNCYEKMGYEKMFINSKLSKCFHVEHIPNLLWYEIDCEEDLIEAERIFRKKKVRSAS